MGNTISDIINNIMTTRPNCFSHNDIILLYDDCSKHDSDIIYNAMDKNDYSKASGNRYLDLDNLKKTVKEYKFNNPEAILDDIKLYKTKRGVVPVNTYTFYWEYLGKIIVINV